MIKKFGICLLIAALLSLTACSGGSEECAELSEEEIQAILADVTGGEEALRTTGLKYFSELSSENKNLIAPADLNALIEEGAVNIAWFEVGNNIDQLPTDKRIVVTCYSGQSAGQVIGTLRMMGYDAISLLGGMNNG